MTSDSQHWVSTARGAIQDSEVDFFQVRPWRYWYDFIVSMTLAYTAGTIYLMAPIASWQQLAAYGCSVFWLYRLGSLVHEVAHLGHQEMRAFKVAWNLAVGVITLTPSPFFTRHHRDHHSQRMYGTPEDPEYIVNLWRPGSLSSFLLYALHAALFPLLVFLRFLLVPFTFLHPRLRAWVLSHASALTMNRRYERALTPFDRRAITVMEWLCWIRATLIPGAVLLGWSDWTRIPLLYLLAVGVLFLNQMRLLADHHFESQGGQMEWSTHILDSCNFTGRDPLTWLFFPFSIRYHALHHLFPSMPYHNLAAAHAHLLLNLPADSPYRTLDQSDWGSVARSTLRGPQSRRVAEQIT